MRTEVVVIFIDDGSHNSKDIIKTFDETHNAPFSTRTLKLRHLMSWLDGGYNSKGTTLTGMWQPVPGAPVLIFHIGDTRLYRYRQGALTLLTHDQTMYQHAVDQGFIGVMPPRNLLLQALGPACAVNPELMTQDVEPGDLFMLCSDGLHSASSDAQITAILAGASSDRLGATCQSLIEQAKRDGSRDNITVVLFQCK